MKNKKTLLTLMSICLTMPLNNIIAMNNSIKSNITSPDKSEIDNNINTAIPIHHKKHSKNIINILNLQTRKLKMIEKIYHIIDHENNENIYKDLSCLAERLSKTQEQLKKNLENNFNNKIDNVKNKILKTYTQQLYVLTIMKLIKIRYNLTTILPIEIFKKNRNKPIPKDDDNIFCQLFNELNTTIKESAMVLNRDYGSCKKLGKLIKNELKDISEQFLNSTKILDILKNKLPTTEYEKQINNIKKFTNNFKEMNLQIGLDLFKILNTKKMFDKNLQKTIRNKLILEISEELNEICYNLKLSEINDINDLDVLKKQLEVIKQKDMCENVHIQNKINIIENMKKIENTNNDMGKNNITFSKAIVNDEKINNNKLNNLNEKIDINKNNIKKDNLTIDKINNNINSNNNIIENNEKINNTVGVVSKINKNELVKKTPLNICSEYNKEFKYHYKMFKKNKFDLNKKIQYYENKISKILSDEKFINSDISKNLKNLYNISKEFKKFYTKLCELIKAESEKTIERDVKKFKYFLFHLKILYILVDMIRKNYDLPSLNYYISYITKTNNSTDFLSLENDYFTELKETIRKFANQQTDQKQKSRYHKFLFINKALELLAVQDEDFSK